MSKPNFFCGIETLNKLIAMEFEEDGYKDLSFSIDVIEVPYTLHFSGDDEKQHLKATLRGELYGTGIERGSLSVDKVTKTGEGNTSDELLNKTMAAFFNAAKNLNQYIQKANLEPICESVDPEEGGVMLNLEGDEIIAKVVRGDERPELMCETLFGGTIMMRPYMEDFWRRSEYDEMSLEEKIEEAENGDTELMENLAMMYLNGDEDEEVDADPVKAVYWFRKLAEAGESNGMFNLGLHYAKGYGIKRDFAQAVYWMAKAAENGDEDAPAIAEKYRKAAAAEKKIGTGDAQAQADLAGVLMGLAGSLDQAGPGKDYEEAFELAQKSAAQNNGEGLWVLALAYEHGRGTGKNVNKAIDCYRRGAELGHAASQHSLACYYFRGDVLNKDNKRAFELCVKSAEQGYGLAMADLGRCYQFGNGCTGNMKKALEWYEKAAEILDDPDLNRRVMAFRQMAKVDPNWGEDYPGTDENETDEDEDSGEVFDAMETMKKNLEAAGNDSSDKALVNMSVEDAYAAFSGEFDVEEPGTEFSTEIYDEHLSFELEPGYDALIGTDDDGNDYFRLVYGLCTDENGNESGEFICNVGVKEGADISEEKCNLKGNMIAGVAGKIEETNILFLTVHLLIAVVIIKHNDHCYVITHHFACRDEEELDGKIDDAARHLTRILNSVVIDGVKAKFEEISKNKLLGAAASEDNSSEFPLAKPAEGQHTHLDFQTKTKAALGFLGSVASVNQTGTEYAFMEADECGSGETHKELAKTSKLDTGKFETADMAHKMARLFRVHKDVFDAQHDREQEIENGFIQKALTYNELRSFAWTLAAYCDEHSVAPGEVDFDTLNAIAVFVKNRSGLNYTENSFCPTLCSGNDIHVYYLPDATPQDVKDRILKKSNTSDTDEQGGGISISSLEGLRKDLEYLSLAMETIYCELAKQRDSNMILEDGASDVLYAWCSMTYAARRPIFTEDGPVNCFYDYPQDTNNKHSPLWMPAKTSKAEQRHVSPKLSYTEGIKGEGEDYEMDIPDGFRLLTDVDGREFIAYRPSDDDPEDYYMSDFVIYSGAFNAVDITENFGTVDEYTALARFSLNAISDQTASMFEKTAYINYPRNDLPGGISLAYDSDCIHANLCAGVPGGVKMMRVQINGVQRKDRSAYDSVLTKLFDHMRVKKPVKLELMPDDPVFKSAQFSSAMAEKWAKCVRDNCRHISNARALTQQMTVSVFQGKSSPSTSDVAKLRGDLRRILGDTVVSYEMLMKQSEGVYFEQSQKKLPAGTLSIMYDAVAELIAGADQSVSLDGEEMRVVSKYAKELKRRLGESPREIEKKRKAEEERKKKAEEAKRKAEEKKRREEAAKREAEEEARHKAENEKKRQDVIESLNSKINKIRADIRGLDDRLAEENNICVKGNRQDQMRIDEAEDELKNLGFFKFSEKKAVKEAVEGLRSSISKRNTEYQAKRQKLEAQKQKYKDEIDKLEYRKTILSPKVGREIIFGTEFCSQGRRPMKWIVVSFEENRLQLLAKQNVSYRGYYGLPEWIDSEFVEGSLNAKERKALVAVKRQGTVRKAFLPKAEEIAACCNTYYTTPETSLIEKMVAEAEAHCKQFDYTKGQTVNHIAYVKSQPYGYWLEGTMNSEGFADVVTQDWYGKWGPCLGAGGYGVRPSVVVDFEKFIEIV